MKVVCNSTVLIALSRINHLWILRKLFGEVAIPNAVYDEVVIKGEGKPGAKDVAKANWIYVKDIVDLASFHQLNSALDPGESEVIILANAIKADLVILDDGRAREFATRIGLNVIGTFALLYEAKDKGLISELKPLFDALKLSGFYIGKEYEELLRLTGEI